MNGEKIMALIKCPECGGKISDKVPACIHCGFPLSLSNESSETQIKEKSEELHLYLAGEKGYSLELLDYGSKKVQVAVALKRILRMKDAEALALVVNAPCYLVKGKPEHIIAPLIEKLDSLPVEYNLYVDGILKRHKEKVEINKPEIKKLGVKFTTESNSYTKEIKCPNCSSLISETSRVCPDCGFDGIGSYLLQLEREKQAKVIDYTHDYEPIENNTPNIPRCLTCQSTDIKKISGLSKAGSVAMWGIFSRKIHKQWHCNNCGSEW